MDEKDNDFCETGEPLLNGILPLDKLGRLTFIIPHYQRGYRWGEKEVCLLLGDFEEFMNGDEDSYCLQPLVFKKLGENEYKVVDGQQRLTTIWLLMKAMDQKPKWTIRYEYIEGKPEIQIPKEGDANSKDINVAFRWEAFRSMQNWKGNRDKIKSLLDGTASKSIVFINSFVRDDEDEHDVFDRLNNGKIPLTSVELIRALFMSSPLSVNDTMEIAKEWELIEDSLQNPEMWAMFKSSREKQTFPVRLELLFQATSQVTENEIKRDGLAVYHDLEHKYGEANNEDEKRDILLRKWKEVLECFWWMNDCQKNAAVYNYLGWIALFTNNSLKTIHSWWKDDCDCKMTKFERQLRKIIASSLQSDGILPDFSEWRYGNDKLKQFLLLLNVLECNSRKPPVRFRFDAFLSEKGWDIEHIHSQSYDPLPDLKEEEKRDILELALGVLTEKQTNELKEQQTFNEQVTYLNNIFQAKEAEFDQDAPENLALLDLSTNRAYKNAWFPVKRSWIVQEARKGRFIPPCTITAFMKFFDRSPKTLVEWGKSDAKAYGEAMRNLYKEFKNLCESEKQS